MNDPSPVSTGSVTGVETMGMGKTTWAVGVVSTVVVLAVGVLAAASATPSSSSGTLRSPRSPAEGAPAADGVPAPVAAGDRYVSLGASFTAGPGLPRVLDPGCGRSALNYPHRVAAALDLRLTDASCSGARIAELGQRWQPTRTGLHPPQARAVGPDTRLVTINAGGNDLGYVGSLGRCAADGPACQVDLGDLDRRARQVQDALVDLVARVRAAAPAARVVLVSYPRLVTGVPCAEQHLEWSAAPQLAAIGAAVDGALRAAAQTSGAELVDLFAEGGVHGPCAPDPWVQGATGADGDGTAFHLTAAGHQAIADRLVALVGP